MTDNEIIKVLEDKIEFENFDENGYAVVDIEKLKNFLNLITCQKAKIEELKKRLNSFYGVSRCSGKSVLQFNIDRIKAEAYKELYHTIINDLEDNPYMDSITFDYVSQVIYSSLTSLLE